MARITRGAIAAAALAARAAVWGKPVPDCNGYHEEFSGCMETDCSGCEPVHCIFADWGNWVDGGGCSGLVFRHRSVETPNNECGDPCSGAKTESKRLILEECKSAKPRDCVYEQWSKWTDCADDALQQYRYREILLEAVGDGTPCTGELKETQACAKDSAILNCEFHVWQDWTTCSSSCGKGRHTRMRKVRSADPGGTPCSGSTLESKECELTPCPDVDCEVGHWSAWSACGSSDTQRQRSRGIVQAAAGKGAACKVPLIMTQGCPGKSLVEHYSDWSEWSVCSRTCGNGMQSRTRKVQRASDMPAGPLEEVRCCGHDECPSKGEDCKMGNWSEWSECNADCGEGVRKRSRQIEKEASGVGLGCTAHLSEVEKCSNKPCTSIDCKWGDWGAWSACSKDCNGGVMRRHRHVARAPRFGGAPCEALEKSVITPCNTHSCEQPCKNGTWEDWGEWSSCSATCSSGYKSRRRTEMLAETAGACVIPPIGDREEFELCSNDVPCEEDTDCELSEWGAWSDCSCSCHGVAERTRSVKVMASGKGTKCAGSLKEMKPCNPGVGEKPPEECGSEVVDCKMAEWGVWSPCSVTCGGGTKQRHRTIVKKPSNGGLACPSEMESVASCGTGTCVPKKCTDCVWSEWLEWGGCSSDCNGQQWRHRHVAVMANECGAPCEAGSGKEVRGCGLDCGGDEKTCEWSEWSNAVCDADCGSSATVTSRSLRLKGDAGLGEALFTTTADGALCNGLQQKQVECATKTSCEPTCVPENCEFSSWSDWTEASCTGLCERHRSMLKVNNECGLPCEGTIVETKECHPECADVKPCVFTPWEDWSVCHLQNEQKYRRRDYVGPMNDGAVCEGALEQVDMCSSDESERCLFTDWTAFGPCSVTCGKGSRTRTRTFKQENLPGEAPCEGAMQEIDVCELSECDNFPCAFGSWEDWSACSLDDQRVRERRIASPATGVGAPCEGPLQEYESCGKEPVDCEMSDWTAWGECDKTCGGGQQSRQRQIHRFPQYGGAMCDGDFSPMMMTRGCNESPCSSRSCEVDDWTRWSECSVTCGTGYQSRDRKVLQSRASDGIGCDMALGEYRECQAEACVRQDCAWDDWEEWSDCTCTCGGGQMTRTRHIARFPSNGGQPCAAEVKEEVAACNTQECGKCVPRHGAFAEWDEWSPCSATCDGGEQFRQRQILVTPNECGTPILGPKRETQFCNVDVECRKSQDCVFAAWSDWQGCTSTCNGVRSRSRTIESYGVGDGKACEGGRKEVEPCNVDCSTGEPEDCTFTEWSAWSECDASCGTGQHLRSRSVASVGKDGGKLCQDDLEETKPCQKKPCGGDSPVDCKMGEWKDWGACSKCGGQRFRFRKVESFAQFGGRNCDMNDLQEAGPCEGSCEKELVCAWESWGQWSPCSRTCGQGQRGRRRKLVLSDNITEPLPEQKLVRQALPLIQRYEPFEVRGGHSLAGEAVHTQELTVAFACGGLSIATVMGVASAFSALRSRRASGEGGAYGLAHPLTGDLEQ